MGLQILSLNSEVVPLSSCHMGYNRKPFCEYVVNKSCSLFQGGLLNKDFLYSFYNEFYNDHFPGSDIGTVQLVNLYSGQVEFEYKLFMSPVRGLEWVKHHQLLAYSYPDPPSYGNRKVKSEVLLLDIGSGIHLFTESFLSV